MRMDYRYTLDEAGNPQPEPNLMKWAQWMETIENKIVQQDRFDQGDQSILVSTVFLGLDHSFKEITGKDVLPVLWETMIFGGPHDQYQDRYTSKEDAIAGHQVALKLAKGDQ